MLFKFRLANNLFRKSLGSSLIASALILCALISLPNNIMPASFPVLFKREKGAVLPALDDNSVPIFNPNFIVSDSTFRSSRDFPNAGSIQRFLENVNSPLVRFTDGNKKASDIIYEAARGISSSHTAWNGKMITPDLNPAILLTKLETEQSLLTLSDYDINTDPERRIAKAMGYSCYDLEACNDTKKGFFNQVTGAAWQLEFNFQNAGNQTISDPYQAGKTITTLDEKQVYLSNNATAALYKYTPYIYWANYNVWKIVTSYGWGVSTNQFTRAQIDRLNLPSSGFVKASINVSNSEISQKIGIDLAKKSYILGTTSDEITLLQKFLRQEGYYAQDPTGFYGMVTYESLNNYRKEKSIAPTAINTPDSQIVDKCQNLLQKNYKLNQVNSEIKDLQQCLRDRSLFDYPTNTGKYGPVTQAAHQKYTKALEKYDQTTVTKASANTEVSLKSICQSLYQDDWKVGMTGIEVRQLQQCLIDQKLLKSQVTGKVGSLTIAAWKKVKPLNQEISSSGTITGNNTSNFDCSSLKRKYYKIGQKSDEIAALQRCMTDAGVYDFKITGLYGYVTDAALVKWKKR